VFAYVVTSIETGSKPREASNGQRPRTKRPPLGRRTRGTGVSYWDTDDEGGAKRAKTGKEEEEEVCVCVSVCVCVVGGRGVGG
jgi:hypothetical protein